MKTLWGREVLGEGYQGEGHQRTEAVRNPFWVVAVDLADWVLLSS